MGNVPPTRRNKAKDARKKESSKSNSSKSVSTANSTDGHLTDDSVEKSIRHRVYLQNEPIPDDAPPEIKLVRQYLYHKDSQNFQGMKALTHQGCFFYFTDAEADMPEREFIEALEDTFASFPNLHFFWKYMKVAGVDALSGCTIVKVRDYYGVGKHDGEPYAFGPYEAIPETGKIIRDENITIAFFIKDDKIMKARIDAFGEIVGPPGFYLKIGGVIPDLS